MNILKVNRSHQITLQSLLVLKIHRSGLAIKSIPEIKGQCCSQARWRTRSEHSSLSGGTKARALTYMCHPQLPFFRAFFFFFCSGDPPFQVLQRQTPPYIFWKICIFKLNFLQFLQISAPKFLQKFVRMTLVFSQKNLFWRPYFWKRGWHIPTKNLFEYPHPIKGRTMNLGWNTTQNSTGANPLLCLSSTLDVSFCQHPWDSGPISCSWSRMVLEPSYGSY